MTSNTEQMAHEDWKDDILDVFRNAEYDMSPGEVAKRLNVSRQHIRPYIEFLEEQHLIRENRKFGRTRLFELVEE